MDSIYIPCESSDASRNSARGDAVWTPVLPSGEDRLAELGTLRSTAFEIDVVDVDRSTRGAPSRTGTGNGARETMIANLSRPRRFCWYLAHSLESPAPGRTACWRDAVLRCAGRDVVRGPPQRPRRPRPIDMQHIRNFQSRAHRPRQIDACRPHYSARRRTSEREMRASPGSMDWRRARLTIKRDRRLIYRSREDEIICQHYRHAWARRFLL